MTLEQRYLFHAIAYLGRLQIRKSVPTMRKFRGDRLTNLSVGIS